jgi:hypothetical protein
VADELGHALLALRGAGVLVEAFGHDSLRDRTGPSKRLGMTRSGIGPDGRNAMAGTCPAIPSSAR